ncbi:MULTISPECIES: Ig-like domain-containing protein [Paenibacillus]|uniref:BIG2 domain-containing protein n=1 Tax=Paenibacillus albilobatus TaxID=2716884 RepID=A0A920CBX9_9BACL|nr:MULTISPECIES: Ig-like domain-containing protein [Paenibacillus]GIO33940.1 hypothetical protein J2TS6_50810 [Paenibacillus albilobatus]
MSRKVLRLWIAFMAGLLLMVGLLPGLGQAAAEEAQSTVEWSRDYGSSSEGQGVIPTSDGGYLALGGIYDADKPEGYSYQKAYVLKLDAEGEVTWERKLKYLTTRNAAYRAIETKDGGYLVAGITVTEGEPKDRLYMIRLDSSGNVLWERVQKDDAIHSTPKSVVETDDGSFLIAGEGMVSWVAYEQGYILKVDPNGETLWYNKYRLTGTGDFLTDLIPANDGGYVAVGHAGMVEYESKDFDAMLILKIDDQGKVLWSKQFVDPRSGWTAYSIVGTEDGGYLILSRKYSGNGATLLTKTDLDGQVKWEKTFLDGADFYRIYNRLVRTKDGYAMLGKHATRIDWNRDVKYQYGVLRVDENGDTISEELFKGPPIASVGIAAATKDGGFIFPGTVLRGDDRKFQLMKLSPPADRQPVERTLTGISFMEKEKKLKTGTSFSTVLQAVYSDGTKNDLSSAALYISGDDNIVEVDALGRITGHEPGSTYIEANYEGFTAMMNVTVLPEDTDELSPVQGDFGLDSGEYSLLEGTTLDIKVTVYGYNPRTETDVTKLATYSSDRPDIAEVDGDGNLIGHKAGKTRIYAKYKGSSVYAEVLVVRAAAPTGDGQPEEPNNGADSPEESDGSEQESAQK